MLAKSNKLNSVEFTKVFTKGRSFHTDFFIVKILPQNKPGTSLQASVVVSKKIAKQAFFRNRIKRKVFSLLSPYANNKVMIIFLVKPNKHTELSTIILRDELKKIFDLVL